MKPNPAIASAAQRNYSERFQDRDAVNFYDANEYGSASYSTAIWQLQQPVLKQILKKFRDGRTSPIRLLDFACGTGRVLSSLESLVESADGIDISENMVAVARTKCVKARLQVGDILMNSELLRGNYDVISSFRFLLNVEPEMRRQVLHRLRTVLRAPDGLLMVNVHGNSRSLRHPAIIWRRRRERAKKSDAMLNEMSPVEIKTLLQECGFRIVRQFGFGILPPTFYRTPFRDAAKIIDRTFAGDHWWNDWSIDMLFVCQAA